MIDEKWYISEPSLCLFLCLFLCVCLWLACRSCEAVNDDDLGIWGSSGTFSFLIGVGLEACDGSVWASCCVLLNPC